MAHEVETIAWKGPMPWHGLGVRFEGELTPAQMLKKARLDWSVSKRPMWTSLTPEGKTPGLPVEGMHSLVRDSDNYTLGVCGPEYVPFQNSETLDLFKRFTDAGHMSLDVAGSLKRGRIIWALAKMNLVTQLNGDAVDYYLLMVSPHIWGKSLDLMFTPVRVVCMNTLQLALNKKATERFRAIHNQKFSDIKSSAEQVVEQAIVAQKLFHETAAILASTKIKDIQQLYKYYAQMFNPDLLQTSPINPGEFGRKADYILTLYHNGPGSKLDTASGTWWGAFNAVTHYVDHLANKTNERDPSLTNAWFGANARLKRTALELATEYAKAA